jgi:hypothetical protein
MIAHLFSHSRMDRGRALEDRKLHDKKSAHDYLPNSANYST